MKVGYFHRELDQPSRTVRLMRQSVRQALPGVAIVKLPDAGGPLALAVLQAYASVTGEWLFLDTDTIVQRDVRHVFDEAFDIAVADRAGTLTEADRSGTALQAMPFNKGAVFSRSQLFWDHSLAVLQAMSLSRQAWMGDQIGMNLTISGGKFLVKILPNSYNYPPQSAQEDVSDKHVLHYKGRRKAWMLERAA